MASGEKRFTVGNQCFDNFDPKVVDIFCLRVSAYILFYSYPCFSFSLRCLFGLPSVVNCRTPYIEYGWTSYMCQYNDCLKFGKLWRGPFCKRQTAFFQCKVLSKSGQFGKPISFHNLDPKVIDIVFLMVPFFFLFSPFSCHLHILHLREFEKCSNCWVSHLFSIWKYRFPYGI